MTYDFICALCSFFEPKKQQCFNAQCGHYHDTPFIKQRDCPNVEWISPWELETPNMKWY